MLDWIAHSINIRLLIYEDLINIRFDLKVLAVAPPKKCKRPKLYKLDRELSPASFYILEDANLINSLAMVTI